MGSAEALVTRLLEVAEASGGRGVGIVLYGIAREYGAGFARHVERAYESHCEAAALEWHAASFGPRALARALPGREAGGETKTAPACDRGGE